MSIAEQRPFGRRLLSLITPLSRFRRLVMLAVLVLFLLQYARIEWLVGGLSGSVVVGYLNLLDVFAYVETLASSWNFSLAALWAVLPLVALYLVFGRAFCGWVCPLDFLFELVGKAGGRKAVHKKNVLMDNAARAGYAFSVLVIILALISGIPFFTRYFSPVTGFFRVITGGVFAAIGLPVQSGLLLFSAGLLALLIILDLFYPRLWCRVLCPIGKTYGLFNKVSFLRLSIYRNECGECNLCEQKCYMGVKIARYVDQADLRDGECIFCGRCVEGCRTKGKLLHLKFRRPS